MKSIVSGIGVDAGMIMVGDMDYLKTVKSSTKDLKRLGTVIKVPKGNYKVKWYIGETWHGKIEGAESLKVSSGSVFVCDPCYIIGKPKHKDWMDYLEATDYCRKLNNNQVFIIDEMRGDGVYDVKLDFAKQT